MRVNISYKHSAGTHGPVVLDKDIPEGDVLSYKIYPEYVVMRNEIAVAYITTTGMASYKQGYNNNLQFSKGTVITFEQTSLTG